MANLLKVEGKYAGIIKAGFAVLAVLILALGCVVHKNAYDAEQAEDATDSVVGIHIKGAVENSGYYEVPMGTRVRELGDFAGGFLDNADFDGVNLAEFVKDGQEVYVPFKGTKENGAVNLNTVTYEELLEISGVGETTARQIINYRNKNGSFEKVIELKTVLGTSKYNSIRESFYVE